MADETAERSGPSVALIAGYRYAGKSLVLQHLERSGYAVADNLPLRLLPAFLAGPEPDGLAPGRIAVVVDLFSEGGNGEDAARRMAEAKAAVASTGGACAVVLMIASDSAMSERHAQSGSADSDSEAAAARRRDAERDFFSGLRARADLVLDSSYVSPIEERDLIIRAAEGEPRRGPAVVEILSFGFKHGAPAADVVVDVRFVPNPYYHAELRPTTGKDAACAEFVLSHESAWGVLEGLSALVRAMAPAYAAQGRPLLRVGIGCTGGRHRSVALVEALYARVEAEGFEARRRHRDLDAALAAQV